MYDYNTGLYMASFTVKADFPVDGVKAGVNLAPKFKPVSDGVWELPVTNPPRSLGKGKLTVEVRDRQGNASRIERTFSISEKRR
jgi:hypothetical protein